MQQIAWSIKPLGEEPDSKLGGSILVQQAFLADITSRKNRKNMLISSGPRAKAWATTTGGWVGGGVKK